MAAQTEALLQQMQDQIAALQINLAASAAATLAASNAAAAATTALAGLPPTGTPNLGTAAPIFARSHAMANAAAFLDLATSTGAKLFKLCAEPLSRSFDFVDPSDLQVFLDLLKTKSKVHQLHIAKVAPKKDKPAPKDSSKAKQDKEQKWAWKKVLPKEGEPVTRVVDGKTYHLACEHHPNQWVCHTTTKCSKNPANNGVPKDAHAKQRLKKARLAAAALLAEDEEEEESDEDPDSY
jgi:hypothetical protein